MNITVGREMAAAVDVWGCVAGMPLLFAVAAVRPAVCVRVLEWI